MKILFKNIKELIQVRENSIAFVSGKDMKVLPTIKNAFLLIEDGLIVDFGSMDELSDTQVNQVIDASGKMIMPTWCDSHTHIVYAGNREGEFVDRINGLTYESELKMLRVIKRLKENYPIEIKATFLGAHAVPSNYKNNKEGYLKMLIDEVIPQVSKENLAEFVDVFCEKGYFSVEDTEAILKAGKKYGLIPKIHVNQFTSIGGVQIGVQYNALSVDHLEVMNAEDISVLKNTRTMPVALPSCSYFLGIPYTPARKIIDEGLPLALATDYNPGSTPSGNMNFVVSTACIKMKMTPEEAINAATINGAYAMGLETKVGSISKGKLANLILTKPINSYGFIPYSFGNNQIESVFVKGKKIKQP